MDQATADKHRKWLHHQRHRWHELVLADPNLSGQGAALKLCGYILHRYMVEKSYAQFSIEKASEELGVSVRQLRRAKKLLRDLYWIRVEHVGGDKGWKADRYRLGNGPEDRDFTAEVGVVDDTE